MRALVLVVVLASCREEYVAPAEGPALLREVEALLARREATLDRYHLRGRSERAGQVVAFSFSYRSPNLLHARIYDSSGGITREASFDGAQLYELDRAAGALTRYKLSLSREKSALLLAQSFSHFAPEGYRVPRFVPSTTQVRRIARPGAPSAIRLETTARASDGGAAANVAYELRWPTMDFLLKQSEAEGHATEVRMDAERCWERPRRCLPTRLSVWQAGERIETLAYEHVSFDEVPPRESFTLRAPDGGTTLDRELYTPP